VPQSSRVALRIFSIEHSPSALKVLFAVYRITGSRRSTGETIEYSGVMPSPDCCWIFLAHRSPGCCNES